MLQGSYDVQANTLRLFTVLTSLRADWAGSLVLACGLRGAGADLAMAANIAGAACLSIDRSTEACRAAMRFGAVDFVVNTVDEALRVLKNEVRKRQPISVALENESAASLDELLDRGVLPQLFSAFALSSEDPDEATFVDAATCFHDQGASLVSFDATLESLPFVMQSRDIIKSFTEKHELELKSFSFDSAAALRSFDAQVLDLIHAEDPRHRWAAVAPRHFHRDRFTKAPSYRRALFLTHQEHETLMRNLAVAPTQLLP